MAQTIESASPPPNESSKIERRKQQEDICKVCGSASARWHYRGLICSRCRVFFIRCAHLNRTAPCRFRNICEITRENVSNCASCRLRKCLLIGMKLEGKYTFYVGRKNKKTPVKYFTGWEQAVRIGNAVPSLASYGPKAIQHLEAAGTSTEYSSLLVHFDRFIDNCEGPSPSTVSVNLGVSLRDLLLNPLLCASRDTAALDQMVGHTQHGLTYHFYRSYGRIATSFTDFVMSLQELKLVQANFESYMMLKAVYTKYRRKESHEQVVELLSKQTAQGAPDSYLNRVNAKCFLTASRTVETVFSELQISQNEFVLLVAIVLLTAPVTLSDQGAFIARNGRRRLSAILAGYIEERYPSLTVEERRRRLQSLLGTGVHFRELGYLFGMGIIAMVLNNWGGMRSRLAVEFHLEEHKQ